MGTIRRFEDIAAWQKARELTRAVYAISSDGAFARDFNLRDRIRRAATPVMANIAEGFDRGGTREFVRFLRIAKGSAAEIQAHLYVALDAAHIDQEAFVRVYEAAGDTGRLIGGLIRYLKMHNAEPATRKIEP